LCLGLVVAEQNPHLDLDGVERLRPNALSALGGEHLEITVGVPAMYRECLDLGIHDPIVENPMLVMDALLLDQVDAIVRCRKDSQVQSGTIVRGPPFGRSGTRSRRQPLTSGRHTCSPS
jgi:hypothetical protein